MTKLPTLEEILMAYKRYPYGTDEEPHMSGDEAKAAVQRLFAAERLDERNQVALDNYDGHTFGTETDWRTKFDKFIRGNNARIASLQEQQTPEG